MKDEINKLQEELNKTWNKCSDTEKIERLRGELRNFRYLTIRVSSLEQQLYKLNNHSHDTNGKVVAPIENFGQGVSTPGAVMSRDLLS